MRDCLEAAACLAKAGVVHADIKPDNIAFRECVQWHTTHTLSLSPDPTCRAAQTWQLRRARGGAG